MNDKELRLDIYNFVKSNFKRTESIKGYGIITYTEPEKVILERCNLIYDWILNGNDKSKSE